MPPRVARSSVSVAAPKNAKNKSCKRNLDAYSIASHSIKPSRVTPHRLGESLDDNPRQKRRRINSDDEDASEDDSAPQRKLPKGRGRGIAEDDGGVEEGSDSEGNEWTLGGLAEDDEDSELDSDEAFGESDEERFEGFTFRGSSGGGGKQAPKKRKPRPVEDEGEDINLDEDGESSEEEDEEDDFGDEGVDLATMLDDEDEDNLGRKDRTQGDMGEESASEDIDDDGSVSSSSGEEEDDEADNEERMARLRDRLEAMDGSTALSRPAAAPDQSGALSVDDLLADLDPSSRKQYAAALKTKKKSQAPKTLTAPLPKRHQDRLNREAASAKAKEQLDRWRDTVIHNRRAEFLTFPLVDPNRQDPIGKDKFVTDAAPQGELEESIRKIMEESGMVAKPGEKKDDEEEEILKAEELVMNDLPLEEVMRRRAELRRTRELLFREEIKAKRIAKIKSKSYRRVHRKERERLAEKERALLGDADMQDDDRELTDRRRAEDRMSTKHRDSKFAKSLKATNRTVWDEGARSSVYDQARRHEELRRRIAGEDVGDRDEGSDVPSGSEDDDEAGDDHASTLRQLNRLKEQGAGIGQKGVGGMKFMRAAEERQRARNVEDIERMRKEMAVADGEEVGSEEDQEQEEGLGRAIFGPRPKASEKQQTKIKRLELEEGHLSDEGEDAIEGDETKARRAESAQQQQAKQQPRSILKKTDGASGPLSKGPLGRDRRDPDAAPAAAAEETGMSTWLTDAGAKKSKKDRQREREAGGGEIVTSIASATEQPKAKASKANKPQPSKRAEESAADGASAGVAADGWQTVPFTNSHATSDDNASDADEPSAQPMLTPAEQKTSFHRRAFAGDDVAAAFAAEKAADVESEDEKEVSTHLPGWGSWTGSGLSKSIRKANAKAKHNPLYKSKLPGGVKAADRKDAKLGDKVIVSEKSDRKGKKYLAPVLPHQFEAREQYERALRVPVGPEWTTKEVFQRGTRPRVVVKPGVVVGPIEKPLL